MSSLDMTRTNAPHCDIRVYRNETRVLVVLSGSLVMQNTEKVRNRVHPLLDPSNPIVDIFLGQLGFIDSSGLGMLVGFQTTARKNKVEMRILGPTPAHMHLFEGTRLNLVFRIVDPASSAAIVAELAVAENELQAP